MNITVNPDSGWFASLPTATAHFVMGKLAKAQGDKRHPVTVRFHGEHWSAPKPSAATNQRAAMMGRELAKDFRDVPPWKGAGEGR